MYIPLLYIKLCIYRGWQAVTAHRKCAISDIAITSARNNIFGQDKKAAYRSHRGLYLFPKQSGPGCLPAPKCMYVYIYRCFTSNFVYIGGGKQSQEMHDL